jgi:hypothetical protein
MSISLLKLAAPMSRHFERTLILAKYSPYAAVDMILSIGVRSRGYYHTKRRQRKALNYKVHVMAIWQIRI